MVVINGPTLIVGKGLRKIGEKIKINGSMEKKGRAGTRGGKKRQTNSPVHK